MRLRIYGMAEKRTIDRNKWWETIKDDKEFKERLFSRNIKPFVSWCSCWHRRRGLLESDFIEYMTGRYLILV